MKRLNAIDLWVLAFISIILISVYYGALSASKTLQTIRLRDTITRQKNDIAGLKNDNLRKGAQIESLKTAQQTAIDQLSIMAAEKQAQADAIELENAR